MNATLLVTKNADAKSYLALQCPCGDAVTKRLAVANPTDEQCEQIADACGWRFVRRVLAGRIEAMCPACC